MFWYSGISISSSHFYIATYSNSKFLELLLRSRTLCHMILNSTRIFSKSTAILAWETISYHCQEPLRLSQVQAHCLKYVFASGHQGKVWQGNTLGLLHLRFPHQSDCDDVPDHCWNCCPQQVKSILIKLDVLILL